MAGGSAILVNRAWLRRFFDPPSPHSWQILEPSRLALLSLRGTHGNLDIFVVYASHSCPLSRKQTFVTLGQHLQPRHSCHTIVMGDFNYVESVFDRWNLEKEAFSGDSQHHEAAHIRNLLWAPHGFTALNSEAYTQARGNSCAVLGRIYTNAFPADFALFDYAVQVCYNPPYLSDHNAVLAARKHQGSHRSRRIPDWVPRHPYWHTLVHIYFLQHLREQRMQGTYSWEHLKVLKAAFRSAHYHLRVSEVCRPCRTVADQLAVALSFLRAMYGLNFAWCSFSFAHYAFLQPFVSPAENGSFAWIRLEEFHTLILELWVSRYSQELQDLDNRAARHPDPGDLHRRQHISHKLQRVCPGHSLNLGFLQTPAGDILSDDASMVSALADHWQTVFTGGSIDVPLLHTWLAEHIPHAPLLRTQWDVTVEQVELAMRLANHSCPGPDGIPYSAFQHYPPAAQLLFSLAQALQSTPSTAPFDFNLADMYCLPKKAVRALPDGSPVFSPEATRPLSVANTDNRLLASAYRIAVEPRFAPVVSPAQRGFLPGRSMLANILDVDFELRVASLRHPRAVAVFYDFKAAFPSVNQDFMWHTLAALGVPAPFLNAFRAFYFRNVQRIRLRGCSSRPFAVTAGIRQGCPLSPLLFAVVIDLVLCR